LLVVSELMLSFNLNKDLRCESVCQAIGKLVEEIKFSADDMGDYTVIIDVKKITDYNTEDKRVLNIEHKQ
jgi:hypothetical protein